MPDTIMMDAATFAQASGQAQDRVEPLAIGDFPPNFGIKEIGIYVYNISTQEFNESRPPNHPHLLIRRCPADQDYLIVGEEVHPFKELIEDQNGNKSYAYRDGFKEVSKMLNPRNPGIDQDFDDANSINVMGNLNQYGVFWSTHNPPLKEELAGARRRMEKSYRTELEKMAAIEARNPDEARSTANNLSHAAAQYFRISTSWHRSDLGERRPTNEQFDCPNCAEKIAVGAAVCRHCQAVLDETKARKLFPDRFKRGPGRPSADESA